MNDNPLRVEKLRGYSRDYANPRAISGGLEFRVLTRVRAKLHAATRVEFRRRFVQIDAADVAWRGVDFSKKTLLKSWQRARGKGNLNVTKVHETRKEFVKVHLLILSADFHDGALYSVKRE